MCGIAGVISKNSGLTIGDVKDMTDIIKHRGPDGEGHYINEQANLALGHRRLSIIDLSQAANQPMIKDDYVLVFNGEVYNYIEIREILIQKGHHFTTSSDSEVIISAYKEWGQDCVNHFNGMWAFAIYDKIKEELFCSRDRFGVKPFYYYSVNDKFYFASEIKQFTVVDGWLGKVNHERVYEYVQLGAHHHMDAHTFFEHVYKLPSGHNIIYNLKSNTHEVLQYYVLKPKQLDSINYLEDFKNLFDSAIELRLRADVKVGTALSGGLDSTAVVCSVNNQLKQVNVENLQETVSAVYENKDYDESYYINAVVNKLKIENHKVALSFEDVMDHLDSTIWHMDEPFGSMSMIASNAVFKEARKNGIIVMLNGQGADEILGGYDKFYKPYFEKLIKNRKYIDAFKAIRNYFKLHRTSVGNIFAQANIYRQKLANKPPNKVELFNAEFIYDKDKIFKRPIEKTFFDVSKNLLYGIGLPSLLHYEDRNSMAHSVEARTPFLDYRLVEYSVSLPDEVKINRAVRKYVLRESMKERFPKEVYERYDKLGFVTPQEKWMIENISVIEDEIMKVIPSYMSKENVKSVIDNFRNNKEVDTALIWRILVFVRWVKVFKVSL